MRPPAPRELEQLAGALLTAEGLVEKDWHVVRALAVLGPIELDHNTRLVFCGGTSLSRGWGLIRRFSEDIDFRVSCDLAEVPRPMRRKMREAVLDAMRMAGFGLLAEPKVRDNSRCVEMTFDYGATQQVPDGLRNHLKVEMTMERPRLAPIGRPIRSFVCQGRGQQPEVAAILCVDPVETAAEKISAFSWRALNRKRGLEGDDPAVVRHLYDLAALQELVSKGWAFEALVHDTIRSDADRGKVERPRKARELLPAVQYMLEADPLWRDEYSSFVHQVGYGPDEELISFDQAMEAFKGYVRRFI